MIKKDGYRFFPDGWKIAKTEAINEKIRCECCGVNRLRKAKFTLKNTKTKETAIVGMECAEMMGLNPKKERGREYFTYNEFGDGNSGFKTFQDAYDSLMQDYEDDWSEEEKKTALDNRDNFNGLPYIDCLWAKGDYSYGANQAWAVYPDGYVELAGADPKKRRGEKKEIKIEEKTNIVAPPPPVRPEPAPAAFDPGKFMRWVEKTRKPGEKIEAPKRKEEPYEFFFCMVGETDSNCERDILEYLKSEQYEQNKKDFFIEIKRIVKKKSKYEIEKDTFIPVIALRVDYTIEVGSYDEMERVPDRKEKFIRSLSLRYPEYMFQYDSSLSFWAMQNGKYIKHIPHESYIGLSAHAAYKKFFLCYSGTTVKKLL